MQLYQPGARNRKRMGSGNKTFDFSPISPETGAEHCYELAIGTSSEKSGDEWPKRSFGRGREKGNNTADVSACLIALFSLCCRWVLQTDHGSSLIVIHCVTSMYRFMNYVSVHGGFCMLDIYLKDHCLFGFTFSTTHHRNSAHSIHWPLV